MVKKSSAAAKILAAIFVNIFMAVFNSKQYTLNGSKDLDPLMERIGDAHFVLLGEASHGTHEYYTWRTAISKRLIAEKGFNFIAVEGDWPDCYQVNRYVKGLDDKDKSPEEVLTTFNRWPTWMWGNWEVAALINWLKNHNATVKTGEKAGFYGLDVYSLWESMEALINYLKGTDPVTAGIAEKAMDCFMRTGNNERLYAVRSLSKTCREEAVDLLYQIRKKALSYDHDPEAALNTEQNALVAVNAERYYRSMILFTDQSWNVRDRHMAETLERLMEFHGQNAKAIVWAHNTHIGDALYTDMRDDNLINIGQLARENYGEDDCVLVGFGSYRGAVLAGREWGAPVEEMLVPEGRSGSFENMLHHESAKNRLIVFDRRTDYDEVLPHRAIGVVYNPGREFGNYVPSVVNKRYDAFIYVDETTALHSLQIRPTGNQVPETYPFEV